MPQPSKSPLRDSMLLQAADKHGKTWKDHPLGSTSQLSAETFPPRYIVKNHAKVPIAPSSHRDSVVAAPASHFGVVPLSLPPPNPHARFDLSPHPRKTILPRNVTVSNMLSRQATRPARLTSSHTAASLLARPLVSTTTLSPALQETSKLAPELRRSLLPTPTRTPSKPNSESRYGLDDVHPRSYEVKDRVRQVTPMQLVMPNPYIATPQKLRHRQSKSPIRRSSAHQERRRAPDVTI